MNLPKKFKTRARYTIESLYEAIRDKRFTAGEPSLTKHGRQFIITFPALDSHNQVWIMRHSGGLETQSFSVVKSDSLAGFGNAVGSLAATATLGSLYSAGASFGENAKRAKELAEITLKEIEELQL